MFIDEELLKRATQVVLTKKNFSISFLQRSLNIGYNRAFLLMEMIKESLIAKKIKDINKYNLKESIVKQIAKKLLNRKITYHPVILSTFSKQERLYLFDDNNLANYELEIQSILRFINKKHIISRRKIKKICVAIFPRKINSFHGYIHKIEITIKIIDRKLIIDYYDSNLKLKRILSKKQLLELYNYDFKKVDREAICSRLGSVQNSVSA